MLRDAMTSINGARVRSTRGAELAVELAIDHIQDADVAPLYDAEDVIRGFMVWQPSGCVYVALIQRGFLNVREFSTRADAVSAAALCDLTVYMPGDRTQLRYAK